MTYHDAIIDLVKYILEKGETYVTLLDSGNAYDKILRNYHQFNLNGKKVYRNKSLMQRHYRFSEKAWEKKENLDDLYFEHLYPLKLIKIDLNNLIGNTIDKEKIKQILDKTEIAVLLKEEAKQLDRYYKDKMPENGEDRLAIMNIRIQKETIKNSLFTSI